MPKWPEGRWSGSWQKEKLRILKRYENLTALDILSEEICHLNRNMYLNENEQTKNIIRSTIKYIAFTSMLIDHVNKALIYPNLNGGILLVISDIFDVLGRIAFPIFMFLLIEGYFRTTNRWKYLGIEKG